MFNFTIHDTETNAKVSEFSEVDRLPFIWPNGDQSFAPQHGMENGKYRVYENERGTPTGNGTIETEGESEYDSGNDRYVVPVTRSLEPIANVRSRLLAQVDVLRTEKISGDISIDFPVDTKVRAFGDSAFSALAAQTAFVLQTNAYSQDRIKEAAIGALAGFHPCDENGDPAPSGGTHFVWTMRDNSNILIAGQDFFALIPARFGIHVNGCHMAATAHKGAIENANAAALRSYDLTAYWPEVAAAE